MIDKIRTYTRQQHLLEQKDTVIAGISGGADSVCLFFVLLELKKEIDFALAAVHVNHGLRQEAADQDEAFVRRLCKAHGVAFYTYCYDVESESRKRKQSIEEAGREVRREAFFDAMEKYGGTKIALAHHADDNAETVLFHLARGARLAGLSGIQPSAGCMIRPLLCVRRREIEAWLLERGINWRTDATNLEDHYARNKIRLHVVPYLEKEINSAAVCHINETAQYLGQVQEYIDDEAEKAAKRAIKDGVILKEVYESIPKVVAGRMLYLELVRCAGQAKDLEETHVHMVEELFGKQSGRRISLPYGMQAVKTYGGIRISVQGTRDCKRAEAGKAAEYLLAPGDTVHPGNLTVTAEVIEKPPEIQGNPPENLCTKWFDYGIIKDTVMVRTRRPGDYLTIDRDGNRQKLKAFFINEKIPKEERDHIWLVAKGSQILWVIGYRMGHTARITDRTDTVLEIRVNGGEEQDGRND